MAPKGEYWGSKIDTAIRLPCEEKPVPGRPLIVGPGGIASAQQGLTGQGIRGGAIGLEHLDRGVRDLIFGSASDGEADFDGSHEVTGASRSGTIYTLTQDVSYSRMWVRAGAFVRPNGYRILCHDLHLHSSAVIEADGTTGAEGSVPGGGATTPGQSGNVLGGSGEGGKGGDGGQGPAAVGYDGLVGGLVFGLGGAGGPGGSGTSGGAGGGAPGRTGPKGSVSVAGTSTRDLANLTRLMHGNLLIAGGAGGGGGTGGGATSGGDDGGGGGSGGNGGGVILIAAEEIHLSDNWAAAGRISAIGGAGGKGANSSTAGDGGGGGGGGGGFIQLVYRLVTGGSLIASPITQEGPNVPGSNVYAHGGTGGISNGSGGTGANGNNGLVRLLQIGVRIMPASEWVPEGTPAFVRGRTQLHAGSSYEMARAGGSVHG